MAASGTDTIVGAARVPKTNRDYWERKIARNRERDRQHYTDLEQAEWAVLVIWECQIRDIEACAQQIRGFLGKHKEQSH